MKFVCDNCSTQYLISDEKVGPNGVKVRCKRCGNVILVQQPQVRQEMGDSLAGVTERNGRPLNQADAPVPSSDQDELGQAFDQLLKEGQDASGEDEEEEQRATEIFSMEELEKLRGKKKAASEQEKIDQVFASTDSSPATASGGVDRADWYVAIQDEQVGPLGLADIERRWDLGEVTARTLGWHPGMEDWRAIQDIPPLRYLISRSPESKEPTRQDAPPEPKAAAPAEEQWSSAQNSSLASLVEEEIAAVKSSPPPSNPTPAVAEEPAVASLDQEIPPWEREEVHSGEVARPPENFFDSNLDNRAGSGTFFDDSSYNRPSQVVAAPAYLGGAKKKRSAKTVALIGTVALVVMLGVGLTIVFASNKGQEAPTGPESMQGPARSDGNQGKKGLTDTLKNEGGSKLGTGETGGSDQKKAGNNGTTGSTDPSKEGNAQPGDKDGKQDDGKKNEGNLVVATRVGADSKPATPDKGGRGGDKKGVTHDPGSGKKNVVVTTHKEKDHQPAPTTKPDNPTSAPDEGEAPTQGLSKETIGATMRQYLKAMKGCVEQQQQRDATVTGTMIVSFTIENSGKISTVNILTEEHKGTFVATCITLIIKAIKFPKFTGDPVTIPKLPLRLGGS